jgi:tRNA pseudouridine55 synthase
MQGLLLVNKPRGISSFKVVARVRGIIHEATGQKMKVGHSGTLDPMASGLLVLAIGAYTKKIPELITKNKTYDIELQLGNNSTTGDIEGQLEHVSDRQPSEPEIIEVLSRFTGELLQTPPIYSAIKVNGQRAYKLARAGKEVTLQPRKIEIYKNQLTSYKYPKVCFISDVSSGTYIRSLAEDIGKGLGTGAYLYRLVRTTVGSYKLDDAIDFDELSYAKIDDQLLTLEK